MASENANVNTNTNDETVNEVPTFEDRVTELVGRLEQRIKDDKSVISDLKALRKEHTKLLKKAEGKKKKKKDPNAPKRKASGFAKPTSISAELANFLGIAEGELITRPNVTKRIGQYVREHNLQREEDKRIFDLTKPGGEALRKMLRVPKGEQVTYFNLQTYLAEHFPKSKAKLAAAAAAAEKTTVAEKTAPRRRRKVTTTK